MAGISENKTPLWLNINIYISKNNIYQNTNEARAFSALEGFSSIEYASFSNLIYEMPSLWKIFGGGRASNQFFSYVSGAIVL